MHAGLVLYIAAFVIAKPAAAYSVRTSERQLLQRSETPSSALTSSPSSTSSSTSITPYSYITVFSATGDNGIVLGSIVVSSTNDTYFRFIPASHPSYVSGFTNSPLSVTHTSCVAIILNANGGSDAALVVQATNYLRPPDVLYTNPPAYIDTASVLRFGDNDLNPGGFLPQLNVLANSAAQTFALNSSLNYSAFVLRTSNNATNLPVEYGVSYAAQGISCNGSVETNGSTASRPQPPVQVFTGFGRAGYTGFTPYFTNASCAKISTTIVDDPTNTVSGGGVDVFVLNYGATADTGSGQSSTPGRSIGNPTRSPTSIGLGLAPGRSNATAMAVTLDPSRFYAIYFITRSSGSNKNVTLTNRLAMLNGNNANCSSLGDTYVGIGPS